MATTGERFGKIRREHVEQACRELMASGAPKGGGSYFVRFDGRELPAKRVLRDAYRHANEREIEAKDFSGGQFVAKILQRLGFEVVVH
ncbi:hypothetical protein [Sorangium sp. So ce388]|uniref:ScoMcrA-like N-terminal head domain-containing protein n=2 Tax=Sorangium cellulosum TaxID=56 RepID=A0A150QSB3_SORCE|nr:hypothetical protein BE15_30485 [Sorangium cellulosum]